MRICASVPRVTGGWAACGRSTGPFGPQRQIVRLAIVS